MREMLQEKASGLWDRRPRLEPDWTIGCGRGAAGSADIQAADECPVLLSSTARIDESRTVVRNTGIGMLLTCPKRPPAVRLVVVSVSSKKVRQQSLSSLLCLDRWHAAYSSGGWAAGPNGNGLRFVEEQGTGPSEQRPGSRFRTKSPHLVSALFGDTVGSPGWYSNPANAP